MQGEEPKEGDLYSTVFPKGNKSARHGIGLVVGGSSSEKLAMALNALNEARVENTKLKGVVDSLVQTQTSLVARSDNLELKYTQMMELILGSQKMRGDITDEAVEQRKYQVDSRRHQVEEENIHEEPQMEDHELVRITQRVEERKTAKA